MLRDCQRPNERMACSLRCFPPLKYCFGTVKFEQMISQLYYGPDVSDQTRSIFKIFACCEVTEVSKFMCSSDFRGIGSEEVGYAVSSSAHFLCSNNNGCVLILQTIRS